MRHWLEMPFGWRKRSQWQGKLERWWIVELTRLAPVIAYCQSLDRKQQAVYRA